MMPNASGPGRTRLLGVGLLVATFLAGGIGGAAVERRTSVVSVPAAAPAEVRGQGTGQDEGRQENRRTRLIDQVDLTPEQRAVIDSILHEGRENVDAYWKQWEPGYRALVDSTRAMVRAVMTPEQLTEYDRLRAEHRARARSEAEKDGNHSSGRSISRGVDTRGTTVSRDDAVNVASCGAGGVYGSNRTNPGGRAESKESRTE